MLNQRSQSVSFHKFDGVFDCSAHPLVAAINARLGGKTRQKGVAPVNGGVAARIAFGHVGGQVIHEANDGELRSAVFCKQ